MAKPKAPATPADGGNKPIRHLYLIDGSGYIFRAYHALPPIDGFFSDWYTHYNNEPFQSGAHTLDKRATATAVGFAVDRTFEAFAPSQRPGSKAKYYLAGAMK